MITKYIAAATRHWPPPPRFAADYAAERAADAGERLRQERIRQRQVVIGAAILRFVINITPARALAAVMARSGDAREALTTVRSATRIE